METAQQYLTNLKASQKGKAYPQKHKMLSLIWDVKGLTSVSSFEIVPIVRSWYDKILEECGGRENLSFGTFQRDGETAREYLKRRYKIDEV